MSTMVPAGQQGLLTTGPERQSAGSLVLAGGANEVDSALMRAQHGADPVAEQWSFLESKRYVAPRRRQLNGVTMKREAALNLVS